MKNVDGRKPVEIRRKSGGGLGGVVVVLIILGGGGWYAWGQGWLGFLGLKTAEAPGPSISSLKTIEHTISVVTEAKGVVCRYAVGKEQHREVPAPCTIKVEEGQMLDLKVTTGGKELLRKMFNVDVDEVYGVDP